MMMSVEEGSEHAILPTDVPGKKEVEEDGFPSGAGRICWELGAWLEKSGVFVYLEWTTEKVLLPVEFAQEKRHSKYTEKGKYEPC